MVRLKLRPGRAVLTATSDPRQEPLPAAGAEDEIVVSEQAAAFLVRQRAAVVIEIIESGEGDGDHE
jgi:hypothetical protein